MVVPTNRIQQSKYSSKSKKTSDRFTDVLAYLFGEGLLGSQLREQTDELAMAAETDVGIEREEWGEELIPAALKSQRASVKMADAV